MEPKSDRQNELSNVELGKLDLHMVIHDFTMVYSALKNVEVNVGTLLDRIERNHGIKSRRRNNG